MQQVLPTLHVYMFDDGRLVYGDRPILAGRNNITRAMKLLLILLHSGPEGISRNRLLEYLYGREEMADATNNLRVTCHRLRKMLTGAGLPEHDYISSQNKIYRWDAPMETEIDALMFEDLIGKAEQMEDGQEKFEYLEKACRMYTGEFLQALSGEDWVLTESVRYKEMYADSLQKVCEYLKERREYEQILEIVQPACMMYPFDEWQAYKVDAYIALNRYKDALKEYELTAKMFFEELGISPSEKMMKQIESLGDRVSGKPRAISELRGALKEEPEESGAFYCSFPSFRDEYRLLRRIMERYGQSVYLMLCTITDGKGHPMENAEKLSKMSEQLHRAIKTSLRRCDSFTRCNPSQFLVLLMETNGEDCSIISNRIVESFSREHKSWSRYLDFYICSVIDPESEKTRISFD